MYSKENPQTTDSFTPPDNPTNAPPPKDFSDKVDNKTQKRQPPASISFVPSVAGLLLAGEWSSEYPKRGTVMLSHQVARRIAQMTADG